LNKLIKEYKNIIDTRLSIVYPNGPKLLKEPINHILHGGKRIRPLLCMLVNDACNGKLEDVIDVSVSIELLHIFSLVHDDIMDNDHLRHGITTIHEKWDNSIAILSGDAILALAFKGLNSSPNLIKQKFNSALIAVCEGQALDIEYQNLDKISLNQYYEMINLKTAYMLGLSSEIGALLADQNSKEVDKFKKMGLLIGKVFQIQDDLLEITSSSDAMGKSLFSDILLNKKTYLMIQADNKFPGALDNIYKNNSKDSSALKKEIKDFLINNYIIEEANDYISSIFKEIDNILISSNESNNNILELVKFVRRRII
jgi:geranylgeranyl pyrophosphate synthase